MRSVETQHLTIISLVSMLVDAFPITMGSCKKNKASLSSSVASARQGSPVINAASMNVPEPILIHFMAKSVSRAAKPFARSMFFSRVDFREFVVGFLLTTKGTMEEKLDDTFQLDGSFVQLRLQLRVRSAVFRYRQGRIHRSIGNRRHGQTKTAVRRLAARRSFSFLSSLCFSTS